MVPAVFSAEFVNRVQALRSGPADGFRPPERAQGTVSLGQNKFTHRVRWLLEQVPEGARVLDLGSGPGDIAYFLEAHKGAQVLCVERQPDYVAACKEKGLWVIEADLDNLDDAALRWVFSQRWDLVMAIDTMGYWQYPALILSALSDRVGKIVLTVPNAVFIRKRLNALLGRMETWPNCQVTRENSLAFGTARAAQGWTLGGFLRWAEALGYASRLLARRRSDQTYRRPGFLPSWFVRTFVFELTPRA